MTLARVEFVAVSKQYGPQVALRDLSLELVAGTHTGIVGPSGCGKSTLLRLLAGLEEPTSGEILLGGQLASRPGQIVVPPHRRGVAMVFQDLALWPHLSVVGNVLLGLAGARLPRRAARQRAAVALALCGIEDLAARRPGELSGGQQQRVALARALAVQPAFLLLDEPFGGIDQRAKTALIAAVRELAVRVGATIVLVSHEPRDVAAICGRVVQLGTDTSAAAGAQEPAGSEPEGSAGEAAAAGL